MKRVAAGTIRLSEQPPELRRVIEALLAQKKAPGPTKPSALEVRDATAPPRRKAA